MITSECPLGPGYYRSLDGESFRSQNQARGTLTSFYVENFGCRATQADGAAIARQFEELGLARADAPTRSEIVVLNTCTVTASADQDARAAIRRIRRDNPDCQIVVTGCYAQRAPEEIAALPGVDWVIGNSHKAQLADIVRSTGAIVSKRGDKDEASEDLQASPTFVPLAALAD